MAFPKPPTATTGHTRKYCHKNTESGRYPTFRVATWKEKPSPSGRLGEVPRQSRGMALCANRIRHAFQGAIATGNRPIYSFTTQRGRPGTATIPVPFPLPPSQREVLRRSGGSVLPIKIHSPSHRLTAATAPSGRGPRNRVAIFDVSLLSIVFEVFLWNNC